MHGFLPDDYMERKAQMRTNILWALIFLIVAAGIGAAFFIAEKKVKEAEAQNKLVSEQFAAAAKPIEQFDRLREEQQKLKRQADLAHSLVERVNRTNILAELTNSLPKGVYLVDFTLDGRRKTDDPTAGMTSAQRAQAARSGALSAAMPILYDVTIRISGIAYTDKQVADYGDVLAKSSLFKEVNFLSTVEITYKERKLRSFELELLLDPLADSHTAAPQATAKVE
jgi:Tfp pilus assembly protein PilN